MPINKIGETTKVIQWVEYINKSFDDLNEREYIFSTYSIAGIDTYDFSNESPNNFTFDSDIKKYVVTYGGVVIQPDDYELKGKTLKFINGPAMENDYLITVRYVGAKNEIILQK